VVQAGKRGAATLKHRQALEASSAIPQLWRRYRLATTSLVAMRIASMVYGMPGVLGRLVVRLAAAVFIGGQEA